MCFFLFVFLTVHVCQTACGGGQRKQKCCESKQWSEQKKKSNVEKKAFDQKENKNGKTNKNKKRLPD